MKVTLLVQMTGTRDGVEWPDYGEEVELPDHEARDMISAGMAQPVVTSRRAEKAVPGPAETREEVVSPKAAARKALVPQRTMKGRAR